MDPEALDEPFLTVAEIADMLKINQQTVRNWIDRGSLPAVKVGRRVRVRRTDLARVLGDGRSGRPAQRRHRGPDAEGFWGGEHVGEAELPHDPESSSG